MCSCLHRHLPSTLPLLGWSGRSGNMSSSQHQFPRVGNMTHRLPPASLSCPRGRPCCRRLVSQTRLPQFVSTLAFTFSLCSAISAFPSTSSPLPFPLTALEKNDCTPASLSLSVSHLCRDLDKSYFLVLGGSSQYHIQVREV